MSQKDNILIVKMIKRDGRLVPCDDGQEFMYNAFVSTMEEGQQASVFLDAYSETGTNAQKAKIHACIRKLAQETGESFEMMKLVIKKKAGLINGEDVKSFGDCSIEELAQVIELINEAGRMMNISF